MITMKHHAGRSRGVLVIALARLPAERARKTLIPFSFMALLLVAPLGACSANPRPAGPASVSGREPEPAKPETEVSAPATGQAAQQGAADATEGSAAQANRDETADQDWLVDEQGRRYREVRMPKIDKYYRVSEDGKTVYLPPGLRYDLVREEDDVFIVKQYDPAQAEERMKEGLARNPPTGGDDLQTAPLEAETASSDRIRLTRFGTPLPNRGQWRQGFSVVDIDGDGYLDIVHGPLRKGGTDPVIILGGPEGHWHSWPALHYEGPPLDYGDVAVADFDGDGNLDLAFAVHLRGLLIARGDGHGRFTAWKTEGLDYEVPGEGGGPPDYTSRTIDTLDWNRDGRPDLLTLSEGPRMAREKGEPEIKQSTWGVGLFLNQGDGRWVRQAGEALPTAPFGDDLTVGDFDGDGLTDFATTLNVIGAKGILDMHRPDGTFEQRVFEPLPFGFVTAVEAADLNGDGREDLAVGMITTGAKSRESLSVVLAFLQTADGGWRRQVVAAEKDQLDVSALAAGDLDGDGHVDLVALTGMGERWVFLGSGDGKLVREESPELAPKEQGCRGYGARLVDLDGDGRDEAILSFAGEEGSERIFGPMNTPRRCPSGGSLEVWTLARAAGGTGAADR